MKKLPWILLAVLVVGCAVLYVGTLRERVLYHDKGIFLDCGTNAPFIGFVCIGQGHADRLRFIVDGRPVTPKEVAGSLDAFMRSVGQVRTASDQMSVSDWTITALPNGDIDWLGFKPRPGMVVEYNGVRFTFDQPVQEVVRALGGSEQDLIRSYESPLFNLCWPFRKVAGSGSPRSPHAGQPLSVDYPGDDRTF